MDQFTEEQPVAILIIFIPVVIIIGLLLFFFWLFCGLIAPLLAYYWIFHSADTRITISQRDVTYRGKQAMSEEEKITTLPFANIRECEVTYPFYCVGRDGKRVLPLLGFLGIDLPARPSGILLHMKDKDVKSLPVSLLGKSDCEQIYRCIKDRIASMNVYNMNEEGGLQSNQLLCPLPNALRLATQKE
ncbi:hypothetical protein A6X21_13550 [Planctopirus hydrillae]|uniref:Uncharacterized protein n=1 Tax=Planctopirus hydrillae TaxID=1841610 RepID=A0A1C3E4L6_9PLAN|nr:hypothetical protein A6X21_13550 [Planctopirus hydrillae]